MRVRVRYHDELHRTAKAVLLLVSEREIWFPLSRIKIESRSMHFTCHVDLAREKSLKFTAAYNIPAEIAPEYGQLAHDELRFNPE